MATLGKQRLGRGLHSGRVSTVLRLGQTLIVLDRELRVDRQPHRAAIGTGLVLAGQADGELDPFVAVRACGDVLLILLGGEHLVEQGLELDFAPGAARLDVGQHLLQVADAGGQRVHFAEALVHLFQPFAHELERVAEALLKCRVQLLVNRLAHLFELAGVVGLDCPEACFDRDAQLLEALFIALCQPRQLLGESLQLLALQGAELTDLPRQRLGETIKRLCLFLPVAARRARRFLAHACEFLAQLALQTFQPAFDCAESGLNRFVLAPRALQQKKLHRQNNETDR